MKKKKHLLELEWTEIFSSENIVNVLHCWREFLGSKPSILPGMALSVYSLSVNNSTIYFVDQF